MRDQPRMRHGSHQLTTLILAHKDDHAILEPSASVVRCALVHKLCCTNVSCEWVSCLQLGQAGVGVLSVGLGAQLSVELRDGQLL